LKILIVDDEQAARFGLRKILRSGGYENVIEASDGAEAMRLIRDDDPDLIIADIRMPEIDGAQLLRLLRSRGCDTPYILLSGYELFEIAREALRLNAFAYLLKPVDNHEMLRVVKNAETDVLNRRRQADLANEYTRLRQLEESKQRRKMLMDMIQTGKVGQVPEVLYDLPYEVFLAVVFMVPEITPLRCDDVEMILYGVENIALEKLSENGIAALASSSRNELILICSFNKERFSGMGMLRNIFDDVVKNCQLLLNPDIQYGMGFITTDKLSLHASYVTAGRDLKIYARGPANRHGNYCLENIYPNEQKKLLIRDLNNLDESSVISRLTDIYAPYRFTTMDIFESGCSIYDISLRVLLTLYTVLSDQRLGDIPFGNEYALFREMTKLDDPEDILIWIIDKAKVCLAALFNKAKPETDGIYKAFQYINDNYKNILTLESAASVAFLSPTHFSRLFKEQTGESFIQYITRRRIAEAKVLLLETSDTASTIGNIVGYHDIKHFYKIFKSISGCTPSEYRKKFRNLL